MSCAGTGCFGLVTTYHHHCAFGAHPRSTEKTPDGHGPPAFDVDARRRGAAARMFLRFLAQLVACSCCVPPSSQDRSPNCPRIQLLGSNICKWRESKAGVTGASFLYSVALRLASRRPWTRWTRLSAPLRAAISGSQVFLSWQAPRSFAAHGNQRRPATTAAASREIPSPEADAPWIWQQMARDFFGRLKVFLLFGVQDVQQLWN